MEVAVLVIGVTWLTIGIALSVLMGRRGFDAYGWFVLGLILGPLALVMAVYAVRHDTEAAPEVLAQAPRLEGPVDVLVGFDGSDESRAALDSASNLFGSRVGRLTVACAVPHSCGWDIERQGRASLRAAAAQVAPRDVGLELIHGRPDEALTELARKAGYDVLVVGTRGAGLSKQVLGSVAVELARHATLPVLLVGSGSTPTRDPSDLVEAGEER
jgi:nucleotide-binding universal stress UspA family protein